MTPDPFDCTAIRSRTLSTWALDPTRLRSDANHEADLVHGGYRDRVIVELAQNAADAAARRGEPGRLSLSLRDGVLTAANTGAPLDRDGVAGLASLRASAKPYTDGTTVGRFGVGFAAVLTVCDEPQISTLVDETPVTVAFSARLTAPLVDELAGRVGQLREEIDRLDGRLPVLRLPFASPAGADAVPAGYTSVVRLPLRDGAAEALARRLLESVDDLLLLAMPALSQVIIDIDGDPRQLAEVRSRWRTATVTGTHSAAVLAERPEERLHPQWSAMWALPTAEASTPAERVLHAPTPCDDPLPWPAWLVADVALDPSRRHAAAGRATDDVLTAAAGCYADLLAELAGEGRDVLGLVPMGLPAGTVDATLRERLWPRLRVASVLRPCAGGPPIPAAAAVRLELPAGSDPRVLTALTGVVDGLVAAQASSVAVLDRLGVAATDLTELIQAWPLPDRDDLSPLYDRLAPLVEVPAAREALASVPVPLVSGRLRHGARGVLIADPSIPLPVREALAEAGLPLLAGVSAGAEAMLERLGAVRVSAGQLLTDPRLLAHLPIVEQHPDDAARVAEAVLELVALAPDAGASLGDLLLPDSDGELVPASMLVLPGSVMDDLLDPDDLGRLNDDWAARWGGLVAHCGVAVDRPVTVVGRDIDLDALPADLADLEAMQDWVRQVGSGVIADLVAIRDLDLVRDDAWPRLLALIEADPQLLGSLDDLPVVGPSARRVASYSAWWLRDRLQFTGFRLSAGAGERDPVSQFLPIAPAWVARLGPRLQRVLGLVGGPADLDVDGWAAVLASMAQRREVSLGQLTGVWRAFAEWLPGVVDDLPELRVPRLWAVNQQDRPVLTDAETVCVTDDPRWLQRRDLGPRLVLGAAVSTAGADLLDLDLASERAAGAVTSLGTEQDVPDLPGRYRVAGSWWRHTGLQVDGTDVRWWVDGESRCHASDLDGLAKALAWTSGAWPDRHLIRELLHGDAGQLLEDAAR